MNIELLLFLNGLNLSVNVGEQIALALRQLVTCTHVHIDIDIDEVKITAAMTSVNLSRRHLIQVAEQSRW